MSSKDKQRRERLAALGAKREIPTPEGEARMSAVILDAIHAAGPATEWWLAFL